ncbi:sigma-70 family RNA polymerase sigma factor [Variovorax sp. J22R133]|uniref:sigma-70 family RNA polymerase sigma factor n=1 Tax=Variovorax brevis TaxID=3053503 RepID=UPI002578B12E|nr:sigma-70 family RNA polymerase sigma factor [Variovorax sp. J22R133]MDM0114926.1 sigma-70 family RNA polymerase sigma factor [Variovorax sp. J22R133]
MPSPRIELESLHESLPDHELMFAYASGDTAAFDVLYGRHETALYRFVRRLMGARHAPDVDEVFQETWTRIVAARETFSLQGATWRTWAFTIAHNLAMDRLRVGGREVAYHAHEADVDGLESAIFSRDDAASEDDAAHPSAEEVAFWRAAGRRMLACLDELPDEQRSAFLLHNEDGFTIEAMSAALDVNFETVRSRLRYGLKKLRACMESYLPHLEGRS